MTTGTVKWSNADNGYGFVKPEDGNDVFVHASTIRDGGSLEEDQAVESDITQGRNDPPGRQRAPAHHPLATPPD